MEWPRKGPGFSHMGKGITMKMISVAEKDITWAASRAESAAMRSSNRAGTMGTEVALAWQDEFQG